MPDRFVSPPLGEMSRSDRGGSQSNSSRRLRATLPKGEGIFAMPDRFVSPPLGEMSRSDRGGFAIPYCDSHGAFWTAEPPKPKSSDADPASRLSMVSMTRMSLFTSMASAL